MGLFDDTPFGQQEKQQIKDEIGEVMQTFIDQFSPMMEGILGAIIKVYDNEDLTNKMIWLQASHSGKMFKAL